MNFISIKDFHVISLNYNISQIIFDLSIIYYFYLTPYQWIFWW